MKVEYAGYAGGAYPKKKKKRVAGKFGVLLESLPQSSIDQKRIAGLKT
jgi:hypothetical protein